MEFNRLLAIREIPTLQRVHVLRVPMDFPFKYGESSKDEIVGTGMKA